MTKHCRGKDGSPSIVTLASVCSIDANLPAVWLRSSQLRRLAKQGLLAEWQHGTELDSAVYDVAATIPMSGFQLDAQTFIAGLRHDTAA